MQLPHLLFKQAAGLVTPPNMRMIGISNDKQCNGRSRETAGWAVFGGGLFT